MTGHGRYRTFIAGQWLDAPDGATFDSVNPAIEEVWA